jgi:hypothetical protein
MISFMVDFFKIFFVIIQQQKNATNSQIKPNEFVLSMNFNYLRLHRVSNQKKVIL